MSLQSPNCAPNSGAKRRIFNSLLNIGEDRSAARVRDERAGVKMGNGVVRHAGRDWSATIVSPGPGRGNTNLLPGRTQSLPALAGVIDLTHDIDPIRKDMRLEEIAIGAQLDRLLHLEWRARKCDKRQAC